MVCCNFYDEWLLDESQVTQHSIFDAITAMAYFLVPLQLIYLFWISPIFPNKWEFLYFGTFMALCGADFVTNYWSFSEKTKAAALVIAVIKVCTALMSCLTAVILIYDIPYLLNICKRECFLKNRAEALRKEKSTILYEVESERSIINLIHEIRSSLDGQSIAESTISGLGKILDLEECALWFPTQSNKILQLSHTLSYSIPLGYTVSMNLPVVKEIINSSGAVRVSHACPLVKTVPWRAQSPEVVAIRVPLFHTSFAESDAWLDSSAESYGLMVLVLASDARNFHEHELELLEHVADQVATALAHASAFKESTMDYAHLENQNSSLELEVEDMKMDSDASNAALSGIVYQMSALLHVLTTSSSILLESELTPQQRTMTEAVKRKSTNLETWMEIERHLARLQDFTLDLNAKIFNVSATVKQVIDMIKPTAAVNQLNLSLDLAPDLPVFAVGDQEKLMQIILNIVGNAVKFTTEGHVSVTLSTINPESNRDRHFYQLFLASSGDHFYLKVQVEDSVCGIDPREITKVFSRFKDSQTATNQSGVGLAISKRLVNLMEGHIWMESDGLGKGCTATFTVKLDTFPGTRAP